MKLSVIVPFHNEEKSIKPVLEIYKSFKNRCNFELICVDDASSDGSRGVFENILADRDYNFVKLAEVSLADHRGYGHAIMTGIKNSTGEVIAWTHSDLQTDPADVFRAFDEFVKFGNDKIIIKGNRVGRPLGQVFFSFGMALVASLILRRWFFEINAQPKLFDRNFLKYLSNPPDDFSLDLYLLYQAKAFDYKIKTIDVRFGKRIHGKSKWAFSFSSKVKTILRTVKYILRLKKTTKL